MTTILTAEQIEEVCNYIPQNYPQTKLYDTVIENIKNDIRIQLRGKKLVNRPGALDELKEAIYRQLVLARVKTESFKGLQAAHVLGNISSQTMLHAKRSQGGQNQYVSTFDTIKDYVRFRKDLDESIVSVTLRDSELTDAELYRRYVPTLIHTTLADVVTTYEFLELENQTGLRLQLNKNIMYERKVTTGLIIDRLRAVDDAHFLVVPYVSTYEGYIDIFVDSENDKFSSHTVFSATDQSAIEPSEAIILFLTSVIIDGLSDIDLAGVPSTRYVILTHENIGNLLLNEEWLPDLDAWMIYWDQIGARNRGILFEHIQDLFDVLGVVPYVHDSVPSRFFISGWPHVSSPMSLIKAISVGEHIGSSMNTDDGLLVTYETDKVTLKDLSDTFSGIVGYDLDIEFEVNVDNNQPVNQFRIRGLRPESGDIIQFIRNLYLDLERIIYVRGLEIHTEDLLGVITHDQFDVRTVSSNNSRMVLWVFGIEALRHMMSVNMSVLMFDSGKEFNVRHLDMIVDHMTMHGYVTPISALGMEGHRLGPITESTYMAGDQILAKAAQFGRRDEMNTISAIISTGQRGRYGTDYMRSIGREIAGSESDREILREHEELNMASI